MPRATGGVATSLYKAQPTDGIYAFTSDDANVYVDGPYSTERHLAPILRIGLAGGDVGEVGQMTEALVPDALLLAEDDLVFDSLFLAEDAPNLATRSAWAKRQGTYRVGKLAGSVPTKLGDDHFAMVNGSAADASFIYTTIGDEKILRIATDGSRTETVVDCRATAAGASDDIRFREVLVDGDGIYVRAGEAFWRYAK
jgi:hypothetical protein